MEYLLYLMIAFIVIDLIKWSYFMASVNELNSAVSAVSAQLVELDGKVDEVLARPVINPSDLDAPLAAVNGLGVQVSAIKAKLDAA